MAIGAVAVLPSLFTRLLCFRARRHALAGALGPGGAKPYGEGPCSMA
jgi:hypothetical protein